MFRTSPALTLGLILACTQVRADTTTWELAEGVTSAGLAALVAAKIDEPSAKKWGLLSSTAVNFPNGNYGLYTFWRIYHDSRLNSDAIYRCIDIFDTRSPKTKAFCKTPRTRRTE